MTNKDCRNDIVVSNCGMWPKSCPRCGFGPCPNIENKAKHDAWQPVEGYPEMYEHANKLELLRKQFLAAEDAVNEARNALTEYLGPYLKAAKGWEKLPGYFHDMHISKGIAYVTLQWDGSGGPYYYDAQVPMAIFDAQNAEEAAEALRKAEEAKRAARERAELEAQYEILKEKLGK